MTSSSLKNKTSKLKTSKSKGIQSKDEEFNKRPKDSMILNRQRLPKVDKSKSSSTSIIEEEEEGSADSNEIDEDSDKSGSNDEGNEEVKDEENEWESASNSSSDEDDDSNENSSGEDKLDESTYQRLISQLRPEDMTEQELLLLEQTQPDSEGEGSEAEGSKAGSGSDSESGSEVEEDEDESVIDLEEEDDQEIEGIEYEKMHVDSDNEDLGAMVKRKVVKNNTKALVKLLELMKEKSSLQLDFFDTQTIQSTSATQVPDVNDDIGLEVELYKQALQGAKEAYKTFQKANKEFFRPDDYFAEMIKSDAHMEKIRLKLISEMENIKASEDSKKKRDLKKFGKAIQVEKKLEREKESKRVKEGVKELRKKRKDVPLGTDEVDFDIALEETLSNKRHRNEDDTRGSKKKPKLNRVGREHKFGRPKPKGVTGRRWKENNKESSSNFEGMGGKGDGRITSGSKGRGGARGGRGGGRGGGGGGGRGGSKRPGKSVRSSKR